jgi:hypothetical protein
MCNFLTFTLESGIFCVEFESSCEYDVAKLASTILYLGTPVLSIDTFPEFRNFKRRKSVSAFCFFDHDASACYTFASPLPSTRKSYFTTHESIDVNPSMTYHSIGLMGRSFKESIRFVMMASSVTAQSPAFCPRTSAGIYIMHIILLRTTGCFLRHFFILYTSYMELLSTIVH